METVKLYYENAFLQDFTAVVESCGAVKGGFAVVLDRTAFYPEGGGQPADHGTLGDARVLDVHEKDGVVTHLCDRRCPRARRSAAISTGRAASTICSSTPASTSSPVCCAVPSTATTWASTWARIP